MKYIKIIIVALLILPTSNSYSQFVKIFGYVKDSSNTIIDNANVVIVDTVSGVGIYFGKTNDEGYYQVTVDSISDIGSGKYQLKVSAIGYYTTLHPIKNISTPINIVLKKNTEYLEPVIVKSSNEYVSKHKDTITYNVEKFTEKEDRLLKDILKHLPGVEVTNDGTVKYNGSPINKLYIEGQDMLSRQYAIATNNIGASAIDKVQIIEHNQDIKMLKDRIISDQAAINIKLKNKNKLRTNIKAELEGGVPSKYHIDLSAFTFKEHFLGLNIIKLNNIGEDFTSETITNTSDDFEHFLDNNQPVGLIGSSTATAPISQNRYLNNKPALLSLNNFWVLPNQSTFRINGWLLQDNYKINAIENTRYFLPDNTLAAYSEKSNYIMNLKGLSLQLSLNKNDNKKYFNNTLTIENNKQHQNAELITNQGNLLQRLSTPYFKIINTYNQIHLLKQKNTFQFLSYASYYTNPQILDIYPGINENALNDSLSYKKTIQKARIPTLFFDNNVRYFWGNGAKQGYSQLGISFQNQVLRTELNLLQNSDSLSILPEFINYVKWRKLKIYNENVFTYQKNNSRFDISLSYNFTHIGYRDTTNNTPNNFSKFLITPYINYRNKIGKENEVVVNYNYQNRIGAINDIFPNPVLLNYRTIAANDIPLYLGSSMGLTATFNFKKTLKLLFSNLSLRIAQTNNRYIISQSIDSLKSTSVAIAKRNNINSFGVTTYLSKYIFSLNTSVSVTFDGNSSFVPLYQNKKLFTANNRSVSAKLTVSPKLFDWLKIDFNGSYTRSYATSKENNFKPFGATIFKESSFISIYPYSTAIVQFSNEFYNYSLNGVSTGDCLFFDGYYQQTVKRKFDCRFSVKNISNNKSFSSVIASNNLAQSSSYVLLPRMFLFSVFFNL